MSIATYSLRTHLQSIPGVRLTSPLHREPDIWELQSAEDDSGAIDALLVEERPFEPIPVPDRGSSEFTHFLDGIERTWPVGHMGFAPLILAYTSAGLLAREKRELLPPEDEFFSGGLELVVPEYAQIEPLPDLPFLRVQHHLTEAAMEIENRMLTKVHSRRAERESEVAQRFKDGWLLVDGGIGRALAHGSNAQVVGVVKSHKKQYFASAARCRTILDMEPGQRTPVFRRDQEFAQGDAANSFYFKLFGDKNSGPMFGLIRVEIPIDDGYLKIVDDICSWLLAERDPLSLPDPRSDKLLYPIRLVEKHLKTRQPSRARILGIVG